MIFHDQPTNHNMVMLFSWFSMSFKIILSRNYILRWMTYTIIT